jgi:RHS repeat-associated protein
MDGAGGVGGLLMLNSVTNGTHFYAYDGNGNVAALTKGSDGSTSAVYEYGPFGEVIRGSGPMAKANPFRFSTKYQDDETDLLYYGYRYYNPSTGRWLSRDPSSEHNRDLEKFAYSMLGNDPCNNIDYLGLERLSDILAGIAEANRRLMALYGLNGIQCCCHDSISDYKMSVIFSASGNTATGNATIKLGKCASLITYYWWDCFSAHEEARAHGASDWTDWGWSGGSSSYNKTASPGWYNRWIDPSDASHLMMNVLLVYSICENGALRIRSSAGPWGLFTWDYSSDQWLVPK